MAAPIPMQIPDPGRVENPTVRQILTAMKRDIEALYGVDSPAGYAAVTQDECTSRRETLKREVE